MQRFRGVSKYPNSNIIRSGLPSFCEVSDPTLSTNLCKNIYNNTPYKNDQVIKDSIEKINDYAFCIATNAFMGKSTTPNDPYNTTCVVKRDKPESFAKYLPLAIKYCGTGNNIISPECVKYYNEVPANINNFFRINYTNGKTSFTNKETFENNCEDNNENNYIFLLIIFICFILILMCVNKHVKTKNKYKIVDNIHFK